MSYASEKGKFGKEPFYLLEFQMPACSNVIRDGVFPGVGFCTYDPPVGQECFNCYGTCGDKPNFDKANVSLDTMLTWRFGSKRLDVLQNPDEPPVFPLLRSIDTTPTKLTPGKGLGIRSTLTVQIEDCPYNDSGVDPYLSTRPYNPDDQGSLIGKFIARYPFYEGAFATLYTGYLEDDGTFDLNNFVSRSYILYRIIGPSYMGNATFEFKDPLKATDTDRAQWPPPTTAILNADITNVQTVFVVDDPQDALDDWFTAQPTQTYIVIDEEIMDVTNVNPIGGNQLQLTVTRATMPSFYVADTNLAVEHSANASVQQCYLYEDEPIEDTVYQLCNEAAGIDSVYLPLVDWQNIIATSGYSTYTMNRLLIKPNGVRTLLEELTQLNIYIWWDERAQKVPMGTLRLNASNVAVYSEDDSIVDGSIDVTRDVKERVSRVLFGYGIRNPTLDKDKQVNYQAVEYKVDLDAESDFEYGQAKTKVIYTQWLTRTQRPVASEISSRYLVDNRDTKQVASLQLTPKDDAQWTGDVVGLNTRLIQDSFGAILQTSFQVTQVSEELGVDDVTYSYILRQVSAVVRSGLITPDCDPSGALEDEGEMILNNGDLLCDGPVFPDYTAASQALKDRYAFIAYDQAPDPPGTSGVPGFNDDTLAYVIT